MEPTIYKPSIYNGAGIYKLGGGGGGGGGGETVEIDGKEYPVVTIGSQKWLGLNLDYVPDGVNIGGNGEISTPNAWYYNNNEATYGFNNKKYGLLYNMPAVNLVINNLPSNLKVPEKSDFDTLISYIGSDVGLKLKSPYDWESGYGKDEFKFFALPCGVRNTGGTFQYVYYGSYMWTQTSNGAGWYYDFELNRTSSTNLANNYYKNAFSLRLLKID